MWVGGCSTLSVVVREPCPFFAMVMVMRMRIEIEDWGCLGGGGQVEEKKSRDCLPAINFLPASFAHVFVNTPLTTKKSPSPLPLPLRWAMAADIVAQNSMEEEDRIIAKIAFNNINSTQ